MAPLTDLPPPPATLPLRAALFLDFDGTLVELAPTPASVRVPADLPAMLDRLARRLDGRLAIVSGRGASEVAALLGEPRLVVAGSHGLETRWPDGLVESPPPPDTSAIIADMQAFAAARPGVLVEPKPMGVGLHWRQAPEHGEAAEALAATLAERHGLKLQRGKMVAELRPGGTDKGGAITALMARSEMAEATPFFLGDDVTDEAGFIACAALGGAGILVGDSRASAARYRLPDVAATHAWLAHIAR